MNLQLLTKQFIDDLEQALYASKIISYTQGFMLMNQAAKDYGWKLNNAGIALMWRGGCIIRSVSWLKLLLLTERNQTWKTCCFTHSLTTLSLKLNLDGELVGKAIQYGIPTPAFSTALAFYDGLRSERLPANLLQAQRDYFGAHTFKVLPGQENELLKKDEWIHINWTGRGGDVSSTTYDA